MLLLNSNLPFLLCVCAPGHALAVQLKYASKATNFGHTFGPNFYFAGSYSFQCQA